MTPPPPSCRLEELWANHERQTRRIEELERRLDENIRRKRRRIANLLDEVPLHRRSHLRIFVTHNKNFTLVIEGKLLVGHLDHTSMRVVEREAAAEARLAVDEEESNELLTRSTDRTLFRGKSENEGDVPVDKVVFTHFFDKLHVSNQTVFQRPHIKELMSPKKTSRKKNKTPPKVLDIKSLSISSPKEYTWTRDDVGDSSAWFVKYTPLVPPEGQEVHSVVSTIKLWPRPGTEKLFKPSPALATHLFPEHLPIAPKKKKGKKKPDEKEEEEEIPLDNDIVIPSSLTMKEIVSAIFFYIQEKNLTDESEPSVIVNDKALTSLFQCDRMNFADVQQLLISKQLVTDVTREPIVLTYVMTKDSASPALGEPPILDHIPQVLSFDADVYVEGVFHVRVRDLLRRIKRREFEYTSSRTPARNMLISARGNPDVVTRKIEEAVVGRGYTPEHVPVWLAMAKSAPAKSEARAASQSDARMCLLLERLEHHTRAAQAAWDVVDACRGEAV